MEPIDIETHRIEHADGTVILDSVLKGRLIGEETKATIFVIDPNLIIKTPIVGKTYKICWNDQGYYADFRYEGELNNEYMFTQLDEYGG